MERLTKRIDGYAHGAEGVSKDKLTGAYCRGEFEATACVEKLAEYEDLEEQGLLLRLPCRVGTTVYTLNPLPSGKTVVAQLEADTFFVALCVMEDRFGKTVFLTQSEAEEALKRMEEGQN